MAEVKTGLECVIGYLDQTGTKGKVYYNALTGSAGTKNLGIGTAYTNGSRAVYFGSGLAVCSGVAKIVAQGTGTVAASATVGSFTTYNLEVGSDLTFDVTGGTQSTSVANAVSSRAGTQAGHCQLAYVTVDGGGSLLVGSIVNERTQGDPASIGYVTGFSYEWTKNPIQVYDGSTYAHSKTQRGEGKWTLKKNLVSGSTDDPWAACLGEYMTVDRIIVEADYLGLAGTTEEVDLFLNCVKDNESVDRPETEPMEEEYSAFFGSKLVF